MAHYALITRDEDKAGPWKACALLMAGGPQAAAHQARALRQGGGLAFVPSPSRFRIRRASRIEVDLLRGFFQGMGLPDEAMASQIDIDAGYARRERLLRSFFMGLYLNPEGMRKKYAPGGVRPSRPVGPPSGSGGMVQEGGHDGMEAAGEGLVQEGTAAQEEASVNPLDPLSAPEPEAGMQAEGDSPSAEDSPLGSANQEDALLSILNSAEANDGGQGREQSFDLDML